MAKELYSIEQALTLLAETPAVLAKLTAELSPAQLRAKPSRGEWSANDVLAHLRACADVRGRPIATIIAEDHPTLRAINPREYVRTTDYPDLEFRPSLRSFAGQRAKLVKMLKQLPREDWSRGASVLKGGKVLELTVLFYACWIARHERRHLEEIARMANRIRNQSGTSTRKTGLGKVASQRHGRGASR